jgi:hypothetical protein
MVRCYQSMVPRLRMEGMASRYEDYLWSPDSNKRRASNMPLGGGYQTLPVNNLACHIASALLWAS